MTTIITAYDTADFLALVPRLAGYHPSASLVLVLFDGTRTGRALRIDLPAPDADIDDVRLTSGRPDLPGGRGATAWLRWCTSTSR